MADDDLDIHKNEFVKSVFDVKGEEYHHFGDRIANECLKTYSNQVGRKGKVSCKEYTVLAGYCLYHRRIDKIQVVALGTGLKCLPGNKRRIHGDVVNDCHAEMIATRVLRRWIMDQLFLLYNHEEKINQNEQNEMKNDKYFDWSQDKKKYVLRKEYELIFYISQSPCGDACIYPIYSTRFALGKRTITERETFHPENDSHYPISKRTRTNEKENITQSKYECDKEKYVVKEKKKPCHAYSRFHSANIRESDAPLPPNDLHRTGAAPVDEKDPLEPGLNFHQVGITRTKPGRGIRTLSMSCSDKLALHVALGVQGSLLCYLLEPIFVSSFVVGECFHAEALERALCKRIVSAGVRNLKGELMKDHLPLILPTFVQFEHGPEMRASELQCGLSTSSLSIAWHCGGFEEVLLGLTGTLSAVTKRNRHDPSKRSKLCRLEMYGWWWLLCTKLKRVPNECILETSVYQEMKKMVTSNYVDLKKEIKSQLPFCKWTSKPKEETLLLLKNAYCIEQSSSLKYSK